MNATRGWAAAGALVACLVLGLLLNGCGGADKTAGASTWAKVKKAGVIRWGADAAGGAPFVYTDPKDPDKVIGFEVEIMDKLAGHLGLKAELVKNDWAALLDSLNAGRMDMVMNGFEINEDRKKVVAFSDPYYQYEQQLTVRAEDKDTYKSLDDLKGKIVGTLNAAEANNVLLKAGWTTEQILQHDDSLTPYDNLGLKRCDAVLQESIIAAHYAGTDEKLYNVPETFSPGRYAVCVRLADKELLAEVNKALAIMKENGELAAIYKKWNLWTDKQVEVGIKTK